MPTTEATGINERVSERQVHLRSDASWGMTDVDTSLGQLEKTTPLLAGYDTARDWLAKAMRGLDRYKRDPLSVDGSDAMFDVIVTLNHVRDWVFHLHVAGNDKRWQDERQWRDFLFLQCPAVAQLADLANAAKHRALKRPALAANTLKEGIIVYELRRAFANRMRRQLETFGLVETWEQAQIEGGRVMGFVARHRAHLLYVGEATGKWRYFVDVANEAIRFWNAVIEEFEAKTASEP